MRSRLLENHDSRSVERVRFLNLGHGILPQHGVRLEAYLGKLDMQIKKGAPVLLRPFWMAGSSSVHGLDGGGISSLEYRYEGKPLVKRSA